MGEDALGWRKSEAAVAEPCPAILLEYEMGHLNGCFTPGSSHGNGCNLVGVTDTFQSRHQHFQNLDIQRSGSAAGRIADRPLQLVVRPLSLTHIAQVCGGWTIKNFVNAKLRPGLV